jgi:hypothetical protein
MPTGLPAFQPPCPPQAVASTMNYELSAMSLISLWLINSNHSHFCNNLDILPNMVQNTLISSGHLHLFSARFFLNLNLIADNHVPNEPVNQSTN